MEAVVDFGMEVAMQAQTILTTRRVARTNASLPRVQRPAFCPKILVLARACIMNGFSIWRAKDVRPLSTGVVWAMLTDFLVKVLVRIYVHLKNQWNCVLNRKWKEHAMDRTLISTLIETSVVACLVSKIFIFIFSTSKQNVEF